MNNVLEHYLPFPPLKRAYRYYPDFLYRSFIRRAYTVCIHVAVYNIMIYDDVSACNDNAVCGYMYGII